MIRKSLFYLSLLQLYQCGILEFGEMMTVRKITYHGFPEVYSKESDLLLNGLSAEMSSDTASVTD